MSVVLSDTATKMLDCDEPALVLGGPGSGKTTLALLKAQRLIPNLEPGQEILFLSFSRAAVRQVLVRCKDVLQADERQLIAVKTYHGFCMELLKAHGRLLTGWPPRIMFPRPESLAKAAFAGDWKVERQRLADEEGVYTFDLFAGTVADLLARSACVRELVTDRYPVIILDEFQDTDDAQWDLVKQLFKGSQLVTLADPDQRIFEYDERVDPLRLDHLRDFASPRPFDLGSVNYRSPEAGILNFADAVLQNRPLPETSDVTLTGYYPNGFEATVHAAVIWLLSSLRSAGVVSPTIAVLGRTNSFVADLSVLLGKEHTYRQKRFTPVEHHVVWDAELTAAAAQVVASILEWPQRPRELAVAATLDAVAQFYDHKNAERPSQTAQRSAVSYRTAAEAVRGRRVPRPEAAKRLNEAFTTGIELSGDPVVDWTRARDIIAGIQKLKDVYTSARFVRLFRAADEIGGRLAQQWVDSGTYGQATELVRRALDLRQVASAQSDPRGVLLMTIHKSKGKEFDAVVLVEGSYSSKFFDERRESPPFEASRRLLRVGITRARRKVVIVRPHGLPALTS